MYPKAKTLKKQSPNYNRRNSPIVAITPHCSAGPMTSENALISLFCNDRREVSCNYAILENGDIYSVVSDENRSWCSSSETNDHRAITIECSSSASEPYTINKNVEKSLLELMKWIKDTYIKQPLVLGTEEKPFAHNVTYHCWFNKQKTCPGSYIKSNMNKYLVKLNTEITDEITNETPDVNASEETEIETNPKPKAEAISKLIKAKVVLACNKRVTPNTSQPRIGVLYPGYILNIVSESGDYYRVNDGSPSEFYLLKTCIRTV